MESTETGENFTIPSWLNAEFISDIVSTEKGVDISVIDFDVKDVVPKGDNFLSTLYRITVKYKEIKEGSTAQYSFIVKALPEGEMMMKFLSEVNGFHKELNIYTIALPAIYRFLKQAKGQLHSLAPRCLPCKKENVIVMEDLKQLGYKMAVRQEGLDINQCKITLRALARLHAGSFAVYKYDPSIMDLFKEGMYKESRKSMQTLLNININSLASKVETWEGYEHFAQKLRKLAPTALDRMIEIVTPKKNSLNVLNHGDCWVNNILFRYSPESGQVEDVRFVDFQFARFSSPALDLQYFICYCPNDEVRFKQEDTLLEEYYSELSDNFRALNLESDLISLQELKDEFYEKDIFGLFNACTVLSAVLAQKEDMPAMGGIKEDHVVKTGKSIFDKAYTGSKYRGVLQKLLLRYEKKGLI